MTFGLDMARRVAPRAVTHRSLPAGGVGSLAVGAREFGHRLGLSHVQRQGLMAESTGDLSVRPPINWWPWSDDEPTPVFAPRVEAVAPSGDRKLDALRRMLAGSAAASRGAAETQGAASAALPSDRPVRRGLPRAVRRRSTSVAGPASAPGALAERMRPETIDPATVAAAEAARSTAARAGAPGREATGGATSVARAPVPRSGGDDKAQRLRRMLERSGTLPGPAGGATSGPPSEGPFGATPGAAPGGPPATMSPRPGTSITPSPGDVAAAPVPSSASPRRETGGGARRDGAESSPSAGSTAGAFAGEVRPNSTTRSGHAHAGGSVAVLPAPLPLASLVRRAPVQAASVATFLPSATGVSGSLPMSVPVRPQSASIDRVGLRIASPLESSEVAKSVVTSSVLPAATVFARPQAQRPPGGEMTVEQFAGADADRPSSGRPAVRRPTIGRRIVHRQTVVAPDTDPSPSIGGSPSVAGRPATRHQFVPAQPERSAVSTPARRSDPPFEPDPGSWPAPLGSPGQPAFDDGVSVAGSVSVVGSTSRSTPAASRQPRRRTELVRPPVRSLPRAAVTVAAQRAPATTGSFFISREQDDASAVVAPPAMAAVDAPAGVRAESAMSQMVQGLDPAGRFLGALAGQPRSAPQPLPRRLQPLATSIVGDRPVRVSTDAASRLALRKVGKVAATTGDVIHLMRQPSSRAEIAVVAHELTHVAHPSPEPRFFDDHRDSPEERRAEEIAAIIRRSPILPREAAAAEPRTRQLPLRPTIGVQRAPAQMTDLPQRNEPRGGAGTVDAAALAASITSGSSGQVRRAVQAVAPPAPAPTSVRAPVPPSVPDQGPASTDGALRGSGYSFPFDLADAVGRRDFVQFLVEELGDRFVRDLEQRGGRFRGEF